MGRAKVTAAKGATKKAAAEKKQESDSSGSDEFMTIDNVPQSIRDIIEEVADAYKDDEAHYEIAREVAQEAVLRLIEDAQDLAEHVGHAEVLDTDIKAALNISDRKLYLDNIAALVPKKKSAAAPKKKAKKAPVKKTTKPKAVALKKKTAKK